MSSQLTSFYPDNYLHNILCLQDIISNVRDYYNNQRLKKVDEYKKIRCHPKSKENDNIIHALSIDFIILTLKIKELDSRFQKLKNKERKFYKLSKRGVFHMKKISNKKKRDIEKEVCSICFDTHKIKYIFTTKCSHHFGDCCFGKYAQHKLENTNKINCPLCRNVDILPVVKYYK
jgi:hypothetical protein